MGALPAAPQVPTTPERPVNKEKASAFPYWTPPMAVKNETSPNNWESLPVNATAVDSCNVVHTVSNTYASGILYTNNRFGPRKGSGFASPELISEKPDESGKYWND